MPMIRIAATSLALALLTGPVFAQATPPPVPPENSKKLSEIISGIEGRPQFHYVDEIEWNNRGYYEVTYYTTDKAKVEINIDPVSGQPK